MLLSRYESHYCSQAYISGQGHSDGIQPSHYHFFTMLELCLLHSKHRVRVSLHEMYEVFGHLMGELPYEEYVTGTEELHLLKKDAPLVYETYWEG